MHKLPPNEWGGKPVKHNLHINKSGGPALGSSDANAFPPPPSPAARRFDSDCGRRGFPSCPGQRAIIECGQVRGPACGDFISKAADLTWPTFLFFFFQSASPGESVTPELLFLTRNSRLINLSSRLWVSSRPSGPPRTLQDPPGPEAKIRPAAHQSLTFQAFYGLFFPPIDSGLRC